VFFISNFPVELYLDPLRKGFGRAKPPAEPEKVKDPMQSQKRTSFLFSAFHGKFWLRLGRDASPYLHISFVLSELVS
jgi:hypothetical protein